MKRKSLIFIFSSIIILLFLAFFLYPYLDTESYDVPTKNNPLTGLDVNYTLGSEAYSEVVYFYNVETQECADKGAFLNLYCQDIQWIDSSNNTGYIIDIDQTLTKVNISSYESLSFDLNANPNLVKNTYACSFQIMCAANIVEDRSVFIEVTP